MTSRNISTAAHTHFPGRTTCILGSRAATLLLSHLGCPVSPGQSQLQEEAFVSPSDVAGCSRGTWQQQICSFLSPVRLPAGLNSLWLLRPSGFSSFELLGAALESPPPWRSLSRPKDGEEKKSWEQVPVRHLAHLLRREVAEETGRARTWAGQLAGFKVTCSSSLSCHEGKSGGGTVGFSQQAPSLERRLSPDAPRC